MDVCGLTGKDKAISLDLADVEDTFSLRLQPPANETVAERSERLTLAREAQKVSRQIDQTIAESKKALERKKRAVKILLLGQLALLVFGACVISKLVSGQSESGKVNRNLLCSQLALI